MITSFIIFLCAFALIGMSSAYFSKGSSQDYYLASANIKPWLVGLSAVATNNSGYMFIGVIGYTYVTGLASIWLMLAWIAGDFIASLYIHKKFKLASERTGEITYAGVLANWHGENFHQLKRVIGLVSLLFLSAYAAAQLLAGSKALHVLFEWPLWYGAVLGAVLVALYCLAGGIRASIWTDAAQSFVMIIAMIILLLTCTHYLGGFNQALTKLHAIDNYMNWFPQDLVFPHLFGGLLGALLFILSWLFAGMSVVGQPHIMVRFMSLNNSKKMKSAKIYYYAWFIIFYSAATAVGLLSRVYFLDSQQFDSELALPLMAKELLPAPLVGLVLAGIFAATMSTADSLLLSCSATLTQDLFKQPLTKNWQLKASTLVITFLALAFALTNSQSVFDMVIMAWSGLASAFAPLLLFLALGHKTSQTLSISAVIVGFASALMWRLADMQGILYEGLIGMLVGFSILMLGNYYQKIHH